MADHYDDYTREELIRLLRERDRKPKFGLVWERDEIEHERSINDDFVALDFDAGLSCGEAPFRNFIIEGDNFDALRFLRMTHAGKIKCIYIDPPYNTGNRDFIYNDRFIDKEDAYKHSKWLEFMYRRLELAKELLAEDGVIFVSIDDNEAFHLGLLMEQIFGINNFFACFIWRKVDSPNDNKVTVTPDHEFVFCFSRNNEPLKFSPLTAPKILEAYSCIDENGRLYRDRLLKKNGKNSLRRDRPTMYFSIIDPDGQQVFPVHENGEDACWAMGSEGVKRHQEAGTLIWKKRKKIGATVWEPYTREFAPDHPVRPYPTIWSDLPTMRQAKAMLRDIFATSDLFSTPKPVELIHRILEMTNDRNALVLDFFAGSGTTAHAVLKLNREDGGNRRFILVSNTEATADEPDKNLCRDVCAERVRRVITGYRNKKGEWVEGLGGDLLATQGASFAYLRARRIPAEMILSRIEHEQIWTALQLIHTEALAPFDATALVQQAETENGVVLYVPKVSEAVIGILEQAIHDAGTAIVYSWQPGWLNQHIEDERASFQPIPQFLVNRFGLGART